MTGPHNRMSQPSPTFKEGRYRSAKVSPRFRQRKKRIILSAANGTDPSGSRKDDTDVDLT
jgi:hypothetical protein